MVPGLLQTADYTGALIHAANPALSEDEVETRVAARTARQALLDRTHPPRLLVLLEEGVFTSGGRRPRMAASARSGTWRTPPPSPTSPSRWYLPQPAHTLGWRGRS